MQLFRKKSCNSILASLLSLQPYPWRILFAINTTPKAEINILNKKYVNHVKLSQQMISKSCRTLFVRDRNNANYRSALRWTFLELLLMNHCAMRMKKKTGPFIFLFKNLICFHMQLNAKKASNKNNYGQINNIKILKRVHVSSDWSAPRQQVDV